MSEIATFLDQSGYRKSVCDKGLAGLLSDWEKTVQQVEAGWSLPWDDFANDVDVRRIIEEIVARFPQAVPPELASIDLRFRVATLEGACIWGDDVALAEGWNPTQHWFYYRHPPRGFPSEGGSPR